MRNLQLEEDVLRECYEMEHFASKRAMRYLEFVPVVGQIYGIKKYMKGASVVDKVAYALVLPVCQVAFVASAMTYAALNTPEWVYSACKSLTRR